MLIAARHLVDRLRHPRSRADELHAVRRGLAAAAHEPAGADERALAVELRALKLALAARAGTLASCASCAVGYPPPGGHWSGGHCCSGHTDVLFDDAEIAALALAGTTPGDLAAPRGDHAGCAFRGPSGCSLAVAHRPALCVAYLCRDAERELHRRGALDDAERLAERILAVRNAFRAARDARELDSLGEAVR